MVDVVDPGVVKTGAYKYEDGTRYVGEWNSKGQKHGMGHLVLPDGTRYDGSLISGLCSGLGVMAFPDGANLLDDENFCDLVLSRGSQIGACKCGEMVPVKDGTAVFACFALDLAGDLTAVPPDIILWNN